MIGTFDRKVLMSFSDLMINFFNVLTRSAHNMFKRVLKLLQLILQDIYFCLVIFWTVGFVVLTCL